MFHVEHFVRVIMYVHGRTNNDQRQCLVATIIVIGGGRSKIAAGASASCLSPAEAEIRIVSLRAWRDRVGRQQA